MVPVVLILDNRLLYRVCHSRKAATPKSAVAQHPSAEANGTSERHLFAPRIISVAVRED